MFLYQFEYQVISYQSMISYYEVMTIRKGATRAFGALAKIGYVSRNIGRGRERESTEDD